MGRLSGFRYRDVVKRLRRHGFEFGREASGSHEIWDQRESGRTVLLAQHSRDIAEGTMRAILRQAGISVEDFLAD